MDKISVANNSDLFTTELTSSSTTLNSFQVEQSHFTQVLIVVLVFAFIFLFLTAYYIYQHRRRCCKKKHQKKTAQADLEVMRKLTHTPIQEPVIIAIDNQSNGLQSGLRSIPTRIHTPLKWFDSATIKFIDQSADDISFI